jgi:hypothetical protein
MTLGTPFLASFARSGDFPDRIHLQEKSPRPISEGFSKFVPFTIYAAVSTNSSGRSANSFLHSSEQKEYFLPANII